MSKETGGERFMRKMCRVPRRLIGLAAVWMGAVLPLFAGGGIAWKNVGPGGGGWIQSMLASRHGDDTFFVGCDVGGFYRSDDGGTSYAIHNAGFEDYFIESLAEHPTDPKTLYAGCRSGVYKSTDGGQTWRWLREGFPPIQDYGYSAMISKVVLDPLQPETVYAAIGQPREGRGGHGAIYKSENGGASWRQIVHPGQLAADLLISDLAIDPQNPRRLLIATPQGVFASDDGGATWSLSCDGLPLHRRTCRLAQSPSDPRIVYVSLKGKAGETPWQAGVYRSEDGGHTWQPRVKGLSHSTGKAETSDMLCAWESELAVHPQNPNIVYAGGATWWDATVYKTTDGGQHWTRVFTFGDKGNARPAWITLWGPSVTCLTLSPRHPDTLYFGTSGYIYKTTDGGGTWQQRYTQERSDALIGGSGLEVTCLHGVFPHPRVKGRIYFGFYDIGLLVSEDGGATFRRCMKGIPRDFDNSCFTAVFASEDDARVWAGFGQWGSNRGVIAESRDDGASWTLLNAAGNGLPDARPRFLIAERNKETDQHRLFYVAEGQGVFASEDSGATWSAHNAGLPGARVSCLARDADRVHVFYAGVSSKGGEAGAIYRSDDRCTTWQRVSGPDVRLAEVRQLAAKGGRVYATTRGANVGKAHYAGGVFRGDDGGTVWRQVYTNRFCEALALDPRQPDRVYASLHDHPYHDRSTGGGVIASADGGTTWRSLTNDSLTCKGVTWITPDPFDPSRLWLGTGGNAAFTGVVPNPGLPTNRVVRIAAIRPHHTRVAVPGSVPAAFVAEARVRLEADTGAAPLAYLYGLTSDGFLALTLGSGRVRLFFWRGNGMPSVDLGEAPAPASTGSWVRVKFALENGVATAKAWADGTREPRWTITGLVPDLTVNGFAVGVWLSPREPSTATLLFDDIALRPAMSADRVAASGEPAAPLTLPATAAAGVFASGPHIGLIAGDLAVAFDRHTGSLRHLAHRPSGREFADAKQLRPLFRLRLTQWQKGQSEAFTADDFTRVEWETVDTRTLRATFRDGPVTGLVVRATVFTGADGQAHFRLAVDNPSDWAVARIQYPCFASPAALGGDAADDRLLFPQGLTDGIVINAPGSLDRTASGAYPRTAAVQMAALYDSAAGLLVATHDAEGHCKTFEAHMAKGRYVELTVGHLRPETPGNAEIPYDTVLGTFTGDWRGAADLYKRWARNQPWCARTLTRRDDVPAFLKEGAAGVIFGLGGPNGYNGSLGPALERLPALAADYRRRAKVQHLLVVPYGWENRGTWAGVHYFPARPSDEAWRTANAALKAQGDRTILLTSGYWWVVRRAQTSNGPAFDDTADFERRQAMTVHRADGTPWLLDAYAKAGTLGDWRGVSAQLCHGSAEARAEMLDIFLKTAALGTPLISFDQEIGGGQSEPCYATGHGHPPGYGAWMWTGFRDLCEEIRSKGRAVQPEIGLLTENCCEMSIPVMATYWSRQFGVLDQGSSGEGPVGLFSYLYHEYVTALGAAVVQGQGPQGSRGSAGLRCQALAHNLVRGLIPCPFSNDVPLETRDARKSQIARAFFAFCEPFGTFPEFLVLGETLHPPDVVCGVHEEWFERPLSEKGKKKANPERRATRPLPCVVAGRFAAPNGTTGTILVNATPEPQRLTVTPIEPGCPATLFRADKSVDATFAALPATLEMTLEPFGSRMLVAHAKAEKSELPLWGNSQ